MLPSYKCLPTCKAIDLTWLLCRFFGCTDYLNPSKSIIRLNKLFIFVCFFTVRFKRQYKWKKKNLWVNYTVHTGLMNFKSYESKTKICGDHAEMQSICQVFKDLILIRPVGFFLFTIIVIQRTWVIKVDKGMNTFDIFYLKSAVSELVGNSTYRLQKKYPSLWTKWKLKRCPVVPRNAASNFY